MTFDRVRRYLTIGFVVGALTAAGFYTRERWTPWFQQPATTSPPPTPEPETVDKIFLSPQAQQNLRLNSKPLAPETYWKTLEVPGSIIDRPGRNALHVVTPIAGVATTIHRYPGDLVQAGEPLFTIRIVSEAIQTTQSELLKATAELRIAEQERKRIAGISSIGQLAQADAQIERWQLTVKAGRHELTNKGFSTAQIDDVASGKFITEFVVVATTPADTADAKGPWQLHQLQVEPGQHVDVGSPGTELEFAL